MGESSWGGTAGSRAQGWQRADKGITPTREPLWPGRSLGAAALAFLQGALEGSRAPGIQRTPVGVQGGWPTVRSPLPAAACSPGPFPGARRALASGGKSSA